MGLVFFMIGGTVLYVLLGTVIAGIVRRHLDDRNRMELDDMLVLFVTIWPVFLISVPMSYVYRRVSGKK